MDYKNVNDYEVVYMVRENDEEAREIIFNKYIPIVKRIAFNYLSLAKAIKVEFDDLVQEGVSGLNHAIDSFDENSGTLFYTFVCVCVERKMITYCRKMGGNKNYYFNTALSEDFCYSIKDNRTPDFYLEQELLEADFAVYKNYFDISDSSVFELRYNGFSYKEISRLLDIPLSSIDARLCRIRRILRSRAKKNF